MKLNIKYKYLWFPVKTGALKTSLEIFRKGDKQFELTIETSETEYDFYSYLNVEELIDSVVEISGDFSKAWGEQIRNEDCLPQKMDHGLPYRKAKRPLIHFTADIGWINDPNGLVYHNGVYHLFFQHNPFGVQWDNMSWGHAVSDDLIHWTQKDTALYPDAQGTMFSGCCIVDEKNLLQAGKDALLFYYTAAGGNNKWSANTKFTQRLAISVDGGETLQKSDQFHIGHLAGENRDPKVFYHQKTGVYVMVLFLDGNDFAIFNSTDLMNWTQTQTLTLNKAWECPDLVELAIDGDPQNTRWVFWSADGYYFIGDFDGAIFTLESDRLSAYSTKIPYAAQTFSGVSGRVISQSWLRTGNRNSTHTGSMAIPVTLALNTTTDGLRLALEPVSEMETLRKNRYQMKNVCKTPAIRLQNTAAEMNIQFANQTQNNTNHAIIELSGQYLIVDFLARTLTWGREVAKFEHDIALNLRIFIDYEVIEIFGNNGRLYMACENRVNTLDGILQIISQKEIPVVEIYTLEK